MSDNVIQFGKPTLVTESGREDAAREELNACLDNLIGFLTENRANVSHFVMGVTTSESSDAADANFHLFTSRISAADFTLTLAMMNKILLTNHI